MSHEIETTLAAIERHLLIEEAAAHTEGNTTGAALTLVSVEAQRLRIAIFSALLRYRLFRPLAEVLIYREWRRIDARGKPVTAPRALLRWHYGPTWTDPDPGKRWCYDCRSEVWTIDEVDVCSGCGLEGEKPS